MTGEGIPAFAGMTGEGIPAFAGMTGEGTPAYAGMTGEGIPAFAGMTALSMSLPSLSLVFVPFARLHVLRVLFRSR
jgi:hypothetical protein